MWYKRTDVGAGQQGFAQRMDFDTGEWVNVGSNNEIVLLTVMMSSAIVGKGGSDTGELLVAYPMSSVHTVEVRPSLDRLFPSVANSNLPAPPSFPVPRRARST